MSKLKLMTILGTRPEIIKMSAIIKKCDMYFDHIRLSSVKEQKLQFTMKHLLQ